MEQVLNVGIEEIIISHPSWLSFNDEIVVIDFHENNHQVGMNDDVKLRLKALSVMLILEGSITIVINGTNYFFDSKVFFDTTELHTFSHMQISPDCRGFHIILSPDLAKELMSNVRKLSISTFVSRSDYPISQLNDDESEILEQAAVRVIKSIKRNGHLFHRDLVKNELRNLFIELFHIIAQRDKVQYKRVLGNRNQIVGEFMILVDKYCTQEHSVGFYAEKLCIDSKYLSRILKSVNGKTANRWIDESIIKEAKIYLKEQKMPIQQIADILNFSDQSSFGKFFKKHCGISPLNYRSSDLKSDSASGYL